MHELSIAMSLLEMAEEEAERRQTSIDAIHVRVGELSGVVCDALDSAFELAREQSPLSACRLVIEAVPVRIYCESCARELGPEPPHYMICPLCSAPAARVTQGRELEVFALELAS